MSQIGGNTTVPDYGTTRNRTTEVHFDEALYEAEEVGYIIQRDASEMCRGRAQLEGVADMSRSGSSVTLLSADIGFAVEDYWMDRANVIELEKAQGSWQTSSDGAVSGKLEEVYGYKRPSTTTFADILDDANADLVAIQGGKFFNKKVTAGSTWVGTLPDGLAYTFPDDYFNNDNANTTSLDRVYVTNEPFKIGNSIHFEFTIPDTWTTSGRALYRIGFTGPAGSLTRDNTGQYCLMLFRDGDAWLFEREGPVNSTYTWIRVANFKYAPRQSSGGQMWISIHTVGYDPKMPNIGGKIIFKSSHYSGESVTTSDESWINSKVSSLLKTKDCYVHDVPTRENGGNPIPASEVPIRIDMRRDIMGTFGVAIGAKPLEAVLVDDPITIPTILRPWGASSTQPLTYLLWAGTIPSGTDLELDLYDAEDDASPLTAVSAGSGWKAYRLGEYSTAIKANNAFYVKATFTTDGSATPILKSYKLTRGGYTSAVEYSGNPVTSKVRGVNIMGPEKDPQQSFANITIADLPGTCGVLRSRGSIPTRLTVRSDPDGAPSETTTIFRGYTKRVVASLKTRVLNAFNKQTFYVYNVQAVSMYQRLREQVNPYRAPLYQWGGDGASTPDIGLPLKVTDVIRSILNNSGFPTSMSDIPDLETRFYTSGMGYHQDIAALSEIGDTILTFLEEYLAHFLVFDENAGTYGKWTLVAPTVAPYTNKASFVYTPDPTSGAVGPGHARFTSIDQSVADGLPIAFIKKNTLKSWVKPPETNLVIVSAYGKTTPSGVPEAYFQVFPNYVSCDFGNGLVDATSPDYLGRLVPMYVMLPQLASIPLETDSSGNYVHPALNMIGRRIYDVAAHAIKTVTFEAPMLLIEHEEGGTKKRLLRYYDPVLVNGEQFLIRNVNPTYTKDMHQYAIYECEAPRI